MVSNLHAFADESSRNDVYIICAATVLVADLHVARVALKAMCPKGQRRIHFSTESDSRRRKILDKMSKLETSTTIYVARSRNQTKARAAILQKMLPQLLDMGAQRLVLDSREGQDHVDRQTIYSALGQDSQANFTYDHHPSATEPLLWIPDAVAWAWGRDNKWKERVTTLGLVASVVEVPVA